MAVVEIVAMKGASQFWPPPNAWWDEDSYNSVSHAVNGKCGVGGKTN
jgi:hypothetical protein